MKIYVVYSRSGSFISHLQAFFDEDKAREMVRREREKAEVFNTAEDYFYTEVVVE